MAQRSRHPTERASGIGIEGQGVEIGLCLLESRLASSPLRVLGCDERANGQLSEGNGGDERLVGKIPFTEPLEKDERRGVENARCRECPLPAVRRRSK